MQGRFFITFYKLSDNRKESTILRLFYFAMMFGNKTKQKSVLLLQFAMMMTIQTHTQKFSIFERRQLQQYRSSKNIYTFRIHNFLNMVYLM